MNVISVGLSCIPISRHVNVVYLQAVFLSKTHMFTWSLSVSLVIVNWILFEKITGICIVNFFSTWCGLNYVAEHV